MRIRRHFQPLKSRSVFLIFVSTCGNMIFFILLIGNKINSSNYWDEWLNLQDDTKILKDYNIWLRGMIYSSCLMSDLTTWFAQSMIFFPYIFRALRMH
jgi:hypothetical protein